jgi:hypothetical protein
LTILLALEITLAVVTLAELVSLAFRHDQKIGVAGVVGSFVGLSLILGVIAGAVVLVRRSTRRAWERAAADGGDRASG